MFFIGMLPDPGMFGTYRILLALLVAAYHLVQGNYAGPPAVFAFFVLSGFLMTLLINGTYADGRSGLARFLLNRVLRIYPAYYVAFALGLVLLWVVPDGLLRFSGALRWPETASSRIAQFTIIGQDFGPRLVVTAWSLSYELIFYAAIGFIGRNRMLCFIWFLLSAQIVFGLYAMAPKLLAVSGSIPIASLAFAAGAMIHHFGHRASWIRPREGLVAAGLLLLFCGFCEQATSFAWSKQYAAVIATLIAAVATAGLRHLRPGPVRIGRMDLASLDRRLGDLSYPFYLLHHLVAALVSLPTGLPRGWIMFAIATPLSLAASWGVVRYVEAPVERLRAALRPRASAPPAPGSAPWRLAQAQNPT